MNCKIKMWVSEISGIMTHWPQRFYDPVNYCKYDKQRNNLIGYIVEVYAPGDVIAEWMTGLIRDGRIKIITFIPAEAQSGNAGARPGEE